ncbi:MAG: hypothetical protein IH619_01375 [Ignavibacterium sp.]|nr:hypothetical protein [Ignavibacterium sp.]
MKNIVFAVLLFFIVSIKFVFAQDVKDDGMQDMFVHPFFAHMALADAPGTVSFRFTGLQFREGTNLSNDFAYHIEAGLVPNLGIHLRSDGVKHESYSEMMLMYNLFTTKNENFGISVFGQVSIPTGSVESNTYKGLFGIGIKQALPPVVVFNGDIHYNPKDKMSEYEASFVFRASKLFYPIIEGGGEITSDFTSFYLMPGIKFRIQENQTIGLGFKGAITKEREYDILTVLQYGIEF